MNNLAPIGSALSLFWLSAFCGYIFWAVKRRRQDEATLQQKTACDRLMVQISQQVCQSLDSDEILATTVQAVQRFLQADRVLIYRFWPDGTGQVTHEAVRPDYPQILDQTFKEEVFPQRCRQAYAKGKFVRISDITQAEVKSCLAEFVQQFGVVAKLVVPIIQNSRESESAGTSEETAAAESEAKTYLWGALIVHQCSGPRQWQDWEVSLLQRLATQVAIAIQQSDLTCQLQQLNAQLEERVAQRTTELATANRALEAEIEERKQAESTLRQTTEELRLLQSVVVNTNDAVLITEAEPFDQPGPRILYVNAAFTAITGYEPAEVLGKTPRILQGPKTDRAELDRVRKALSTWQPVTVEVINYRKDGSEFWNEFSLVPVANGEGWYTHWIAVQRDTSRRKRTEQALRQREKNFRTLIENALDIIMILALDGTIRYISPSVSRVLGFAVADMLGQNIAAFIHPEDWATSRYQPEATLKERIISTTQSLEPGSPVEFRHRHQDGSWRIVEAVSQPFVDGETTLRVVINIRDITERKRLDETRLALAREKELSALKTRFFSMASHEFRTPLSTALAATQLLSTAPTAWQDAEKRSRNLQRIQDAIKHTVQLLDDILIINRAESGNLAFNPKPIALALYCDYLIEEMQLSAGENHTLRFVTEGEPYSISLDEKLLRSILSNLLSNAIKYSPHGGDIELKLSFCVGGVNLQVKDHGIGISATDLQQIFEPFQRGKNVRDTQGSGLGLVVVKKFVELHQGSIAINSTLGAGTVCLVTLPLR